MGIVQFIIDKADEPIQKLVDKHTEKMEKHFRSQVGDMLTTTAHGLLQSGAMIAGKPMVDASSRLGVEEVTLLQTRSGVSDIIATFSSRVPDRNSRVDKECIDRGKGVLATYGASVAGAFVGAIAGPPGVFAGMAIAGSAAAGTRREVVGNTRVSGSSARKVVNTKSYLMVFEAKGGKLRIGHIRTGQRNDVTVDAYAGYTNTDVQLLLDEVSVAHEGCWMDPIMHGHVDAVVPLNVVGVFIDGSTRAATLGYHNASEFTEADTARKLVIKWGAAIASLWMSVGPVLTRVYFSTVAVTVGNSLAHGACGSDYIDRDNLQDASATDQVYYPKLTSEALAAREMKHITVKKSRPTGLDEHEFLGLGKTWTVDEEGRESE